MQIITHSFNLVLENSFQTTHGSRTSQPTLIIELREGEFHGFGEAALVTYYGVKSEDLLQKVAALKPWLANYALKSPEKFYQDLEERLPNNTFLRCAIDTAANDLWARRQEKPLYQLWNLDLANMPTTNYTIGIDTVEEMLQKMKAKPWPIYKIKLGTANDLEIISTLRQHTNAVFRVDANTGWTVEQTLQIAPELKKLGVEFIEQPLKADNWEGARQLFLESPLPIIADESCQQEGDVLRCVNHFHGINIKLMKCGGLTPARRMIAEARKHQLQVMMGCMTESSVGISAIAHIAPLLDYVDMDGALLLSEEPAIGVHIDEQAQVHFPNISGTGVVLK